MTNWMKINIWLYLCPWAHNPRAQISSYIHPAMCTHIHRAPVAEDRLPDIHPHSAQCWIAKMSWFGYPKELGRILRRVTANRCSFSVWKVEIPLEIHKVYSHGCLKGRRWHFRLYATYYCKYVCRCTVPIYFSFFVFCFFTFLDLCRPSAVNPQLWAIPGGQPPTQELAQWAGFKPGNALWQSCELLYYHFAISSRGRRTYPDGKYVFEQIQRRPTQQKPPSGCWRNSGFWRIGRRIRQTRAR
jgi:hypothetical protein